jgi:hypothetical protein
MEADQSDAGRSKDLVVFEILRDSKCTDCGEVIRKSEFLFLDGEQALNLRLVHGPIHASWLNQIEIYFSIVQRKVLTPDDFTSLTDLSQRLMAFEHHYQTIAQPFEWRFTRRDLATLLNKLGRPLAKAA